MVLLQLLFLKIPVPRFLMLSCMVLQLLLLKMPVSRLLMLSCMAAVAEDAQHPTY
jgi:hypothetical protein